MPATATVSQYVAVVRQLIHCAALRENNNLFAERQREEGLLFQCRVTEQAEQKTEEILVQLEEVSGQRVCSDEQFISMLTTALTSVNISVLPVYSDCVVFANMAKARKHDIGFLALLGANHSEMPIIKGDCNLLNDENIKTLAEMGIDLEPQIFVENKRERFSLFQLLLEPSDKLYVSYSLTDGKDKLVPSNFVQQLMMMFSEKGKPVSLSAARRAGVYRQTGRQQIGVQQTAFAGQTACAHAFIQGVVRSFCRQSGRIYVRKGRTQTVRKFGASTVFVRQHHDGK